MSTYNINNYVTIYPTREGFEYMKTLIDIDRNSGFKTYSDIEAYIDAHTTSDNGFREQLWVIMSKFGEMFFNGSQYLENTDMELNS
jgi:hypothetical protein